MSFPSNENAEIPDLARCNREPDILDWVECIERTEGRLGSGWPSWPWKVGEPSSSRTIFLCMWHSAGRYMMGS